MSTIDRYSRQRILPDIGNEGQEKLGRSTAVVVGCGALGAIIASAIVRAGVGRTKIVDRDFVEYHNLQRQVLFDEDDVKEEIPKAIAAERHLKKINSSVQVEGIVADVNFGNVEKLVSGADVILDGLDNLEARLVINDASLKLGIPWVYGGAIAASGMTMTIIPGETPCFRCFAINQVGEATATCDTVGVISPAPWVIGSLQAAEALKIITGSPNINRHLLVVDIWRGIFRHLIVEHRPDCPTCNGKYEALEGKFGIKTAALCGRDAVQVFNPLSLGISLDELAKRLQPLGKVSRNDFMLHFTDGANEMFIFPDGRAIVNNTHDVKKARAIYAQYIGN